MFSISHQYLISEVLCNVIKATIVGVRVWAFKIPRKGGMDGGMWMI